MDNASQLGEEKVSKLLLKFSVPAIVGMLVNALYNIIDRIFIGHIGHGAGSLGIAGITIGFPIMLVLMAFAMLIGIGSTSLLSIKLGEQKRDEAELIIGNGMTLLIIIAIFISAAGLIFLDPLLRISGASDEVLPYARDYMSVILLGGIFQFIGFGMNNYIRAEGNPRTAMLSMLLGAFLNTILAPIFIFIFGWGMKGAGFATVISQAAVAFWVLSYFFGGRSLLRIHLKNLRLKADVVGKIVAIGVAPFAMQLAASLLNGILNRQLTFYGGNNAVSGMGIVYSIATLILMPIFGINQGVQPIIGYNYGAEKFDRVKEALKTGIIAATVIVIIGFIVTRLFPHELISLFSNDDTKLINFGAHAMNVFLICLPIIGFQIVGANYFQAIGKPLQAMILSLSRQVLVLIPALLILPNFFGLNGVLAAGPVADFVSSIITGTWLFYELKHLNHKHKESLAS